MDYLLEGHSKDGVNDPYDKLNLLMNFLIHFNTHDHSCLERAHIHRMGYWWALGNRLPFVHSIVISSGDECEQAANRMMEFIGVLRGISNE